MTILDECTDAQLSNGSALTIEERTLFEQCESDIEEFGRSFIKAGKALTIIQDLRLYRENHSLFEDYCQERWGFKHSQAYRLIESAKVIQVLTLSPNGGNLPRNERQVRPLTKLKQPEQIQQAWNLALEATSGKPTAAAVEKAVQEIKGVKPRTNSIKKILHSKPSVELDNEQPEADRCSEGSFTPLQSDAPENLVSDEATQKNLEKSSVPASTETGTPAKTSPQSELPAAFPMKDSSSCQWIRDSLQQRIMQILLYDQAVGMTIERLATVYGKLPHTIVIWSIEALEAQPLREKKITELELELRDKDELVRTLAQKDSELEELKQAIAQRDQRLAELSQTIAQRDQRLAELEEAIALTPPSETTKNDSKVAELEETIAQRDSKVAELEQTIAQKPLVIYDTNDPRVAELEQVVEQRDSELAEVKEQLEASEYYSTQASLEIEALKKELAQANQLIEQQQQPKTLPSGKPQPVPKSQANPTPNLKSLIDFFDTAAEKLQKPTIQISRNGKTIVVSRNSTQHPGALNIKADGTWQGRIEANGNLYKIWEWDGWIMPMLLEFAANPAEMAAQHGRSTGFCCFCNHELSDERSLATGYGATCAQHYGLQWPKETKVSAQA